MPHQQLAAELLARWREVERALEGAEADADLAEALQAEAARLRNQYQELIRQAQDASLPEPPPLAAEA